MISNIRFTKMLRILLTLQLETYKDILLITKKKSKIYLISCWSLLIIFIITSNYKYYIVKFIIFLILSYLNYLWLVLHLFDAGSWNPMRTKSKEPKKIETHDSMNQSILVFNSWFGCSAQFGSNKNIILSLRKNQWQKGRKKYCIEFS